MKLKLRASRKQINKVSGLEEAIIFAVVDLEKSKDYPANFVCMLPGDLKPRKNSPTTFAKIFGDDALTLAKNLLVSALQSEDDAEIKTEIQRRLKVFDPTPVIEVKCSVCGRKFRPRKFGRYMQRLCETCRR